MKLKQVWLILPFFKQKTAYEIIAGDWSSDVCSSDLVSDILNVYHNYLKPHIVQALYVANPNHFLYMYSTEAVSYTHLDVYKRQIQHFTL